jgi:hypothetical protein
VATVEPSDSAADATRPHTSTTTSRTHHRDIAAIGCGRINRLSVQETAIASRGRAGGIDATATVDPRHVDCSATSQIDRAPRPVHPADARRCVGIPGIEGTSRATGLGSQSAFVVGAIGQRQGQQETRDG